MKTAYTYDTISALIKREDTRARSFSTEQVNDVIDFAYAEMVSVSRQMFSNEEVLDLEPYYTANESKFTIDVEEDTTEIYDLYTTVETDPDMSTVCQEVIQNVGICRDDNLAYRDNRYTGRVHVDLDELETTFDNLVIKYYYTPNATSETVMMDRQVYHAFRYALAIGVNYLLKDIEGEMQKRSGMTRVIGAVTQGPEDIPTSGRAIFSGV